MLPRGFHDIARTDTNIMKNIHIKVTLFYKQNMISDMFADILNSENQQ